MGHALDSIYTNHFNLFTLKKLKQCFIDLLLELWVFLGFFLYFIPKSHREGKYSPEKISLVFGNKDEFPVIISSKTSIFVLSDLDMKKIEIFEEFQENLLISFSTTLIQGASFVMVLSK